MRYPLRVTPDTAALAARHGAVREIDGRWFYDGESLPVNLRGLEIREETSPFMVELLGVAAKAANVGPLPEERPGAVSERLTQDDVLANAIEQTVRFAIERFGARRAPVWLSTPKVALGGKAPFDTMRSVERCRVVYALIRRISAN